MKRKLKVPKERNSAVVQLIKRAGAGSGAHGKTNKAERRAAKMKLQTLSSVGQSTRLLIEWSWVRIPEGLPLLR